MNAIKNIGKTVLLNVAMLALGMFIVIVAAYIVRVPIEAHFQHPTPDQTVRINTPQRLAQNLQCWGNDGQDHPIPSLVIVKTHHRWIVGGPKMVHKALDQVLGEKDHGLEIYQFCVSPKERS